MPVQTKAPARNHRGSSYSRTEEESHDARTDESPCEKPQGQFVHSGQGNPRGEGCEELDHRHPIEPIQQAGDFHTCKIIKTDEKKSFG